MGTRRRAHSVLATATVVLLTMAGHSAVARAEPSWTTYHRDPGRSGFDPEAVEGVAPTQDWQSPTLDAPLWNQPLVLGSRVYVATPGDEVYALEAATGRVIWEKSAGVPVPDSEVCSADVAPTIGIVGTPVIDPARNTIYVVADTWNASTKEARHVLDGYDLTTGEQVLSTAVDPPGEKGLTLLQRPALALDQGEVLIGFGGNPGDCPTYRGAVVAAPEDGGAPRSWEYAPASPATGGGAVWGPSGPAVDSEGHVYVTTGNPNFPKGKEVKTYDDSDSVIELNPAMELVGHFAPESWLYDSNHDLDLSSAGPELLPGGLLFQAGKNSIGYLVSESAMGSGASAVFSLKVCTEPKGENDGEGSFGGDAFANDTIYVPCMDGTRALAYNQAGQSFSILWHGPSDAIGPPIVSAGLVWVVNGKFLSGGGTKLYGLDPATGLPRYTETLPAPVADHFPSPSAAGGRVFVATGSSVTAYRVADVLPELGRCNLAPSTGEGKQRTYDGKFTDKACTEVSESRTGKYEWAQGPGSSRHFTSTATKTTLETTAKTKITCTGSRAAGEYTGPQTETSTLTLSGCRLSPPGASCHSEGLAEGEVASSMLEGELGFVSKTAGTVAWDLRPRTASLFAKLSCGGTPVEVAGSVVAPVAPLEKMTSSFKETLKASGGRQDPESLEGASPDVLTAAINGGPFEAVGAAQAANAKGEEALEIKATQ